VGYASCKPTDALVTYSFSYVFRRFSVCGRVMHLVILIFYVNIWECRTWETLSFWERNTGDLQLLSAMARVYLALSPDSASGTALQYRWSDTEWKQEPAEPMSDEHDLFCT